MTSVGLGRPHWSWNVRNKTGLKTGRDTGPPSATSCSCPSFLLFTPRFGWAACFRVAITCRSSSILGLMARILVLDGPAWQGQLGAGVSSTSSAGVVGVGVILTRLVETVGADVAGGSLPATVGVGVVPRSFQMSRLCSGDSSLSQ